MKDRIRTIKKKLNDAISQLCEVSWMFCKNPDKDFTRSRKLPFRQIISFLLTAEGGTLATEMLSILAVPTKSHVEALIRRHVSPIRPGRSRPRKMTVKHAVSFIYRVA